MIWRAPWPHRPVTPVVGYSIIGFFGPVVSLIISIGMSNVAGATKKSCTAAAIFVAYCVGNVRRSRSGSSIRPSDLSFTDNRTATDKDADVETTLS